MSLENRYTIVGAATKQQGDRRRFVSKVAIVTGGGSGIGRASALRLSEEGACVMIGDVRVELAEETAKMIKSSGGEVHFAHCDVGNEADVETMTSTAIREFGGLDILVSNAGSTTRGGIHELSLDDWERVIRVQLTGSFLCARAALRYMITHGGGNIITIGSISSMVIGAGGSAASYKAAKGGILQLTRAIATEYAHKGVRANCVCPGAIATNLGKHVLEESANWTSKIKDEVRSYTVDVPIKRRAEPMEVANVVAFLASDESSFMTGSAVMVDGGYTAVWFTDALTTQAEVDELKTQWIPKDTSLWTAEGFSQFCEVRHEWLANVLNDMIGLSGPTDIYASEIPDETNAPDVGAWADDLMRDPDIISVGR